MNLLESKGLTKDYRHIAALKDFSITMEENKITGIIGRNGAGKTTFLKIIAGFLKKTSGELTVFSEEPFNSLKVSANMIFIDDSMAFPAMFNLVEILDSAATFYQNWDKALAKKMFDYFNLNPKQRYKNLSKGMKSTFNMIIGLSARCALTIFDEPTTGMDAAIRKDFYRALLRDYLDNPRSVILSSHHLNEVEDIIEDVLLIKEGEKCLHLPVLELKQLLIGFRGKSEKIGELTKGKEIYHREEIGKEGVFVIVKNDFEEGLLQNIKLAGIEISAVTAADICVYLTAKIKGGIDHVFN